MAAWRDGGLPSDRGALPCPSVSVKLVARIERRQRRRRRRAAKSGVLRRVIRSPRISRQAALARAPLNPGYGLLPSDAVGVIFMDGEKPVQPDVNALDKYRRNPGAPRGFWPSSPEISRTMLERYG